MPSSHSAATARAALDPNAENVFLRPEHGTFAIARGSGGGEPSAFAAMTVLDTFLDAARSGEPIAHALRRANTEILRAATHRRMLGACATFTGLALGPGGASVAHVGDSRLYRLRHRALVRVTTDARRPAALVTYARGHAPSDRNALAPRTEPRSTHVGLAEDLRVDVHQLDDLAPGDTLVLCSPGVWEHVSDDTIATTVTESPAAEAAHALVAEAYRASGGESHASAIVVRAGAGAPRLVRRT